ncbi:MAG: hypothetical protein KAW41_02710 [Candidatus Diapherotrites archaeon]|nr:hypothetical protein [Candidatus Diapherotrites archaeon]
MAKTVKRARKTAKKKATTKRKAATKKKTVKKKATSRKTTKRKATKRKATARKATKKKVTKKKVTKKKPAKKKMAKKKVARKKVTKKKPAKKTAAKKRPVKKKAAPKKKVKRTGPLFERIVPTRPPEPATGDNPYNIKIVNMVASANFNVELDLFALARAVDTIEYEPEQFPGAILKLTKESNGVKASLLLFKNGKVICTGARSEDEVGKALLITSEIIADYVT